MPGLIAPNICRYTIHGSYAGREIANIVDLALLPTGTTTRDQIIEAMAGIMIDSWAANVLQNITDEYVCTDVSFVDLNASTGSVGHFTAGAVTTLPTPGLLSAASMPGNVALRINKQIVAARGQRQGRMYLVGAGEDATAGNVPNEVVASLVTNVDTDMAAFLSDMSATLTGAVEGTSEMVVVHTTTDNTVTPPVVTYEGSSVVTALKCDTTLGSQRRRLRG